MKMFHPVTTAYLFHQVALAFWQVERMVSTIPTVSTGTVALGNWIVTRDSESGTTKAYQDGLRQRNLQKSSLFR